MEAMARRYVQISAAAQSRMIGKIFHLSTKKDTFIVIEMNHSSDEVLNNKKFRVCYAMTQIVLETDTSRDSEGKNGEGESQV